MRKDLSIFLKYNFKLFRKCRDCDKVHEHSGFYKDKTCRWGISRSCLECGKKRIKLTKEKYRSSENGMLTEKKQQRRYYDENREMLIKKSSDFRKTERFNEYYAEYSKSEARINSINKYSKSEKGRKKQREYYRENREAINKKNRKYLETIPEKRKIYAKRTKERYPEKIRENRVIRRAKEKRAVPYWSERELIRKLYKKAKELSKITGIEYEVDHIVPIISNDVCGLHVWNNLQILEKSLNRQKSNKLNYTIEITVGDK